MEEIKMYIIEGTEFFLLIYTTALYSGKYFGETSVVETDIIRFNISVLQKLGL